MNSKYVNVSAIYKAIGSDKGKRTIVERCMNGCTKHGYPKAVKVIDLSDAPTVLQRLKEEKYIDDFDVNKALEKLESDAEAMLLQSQIETLQAAKKKLENDVRELVKTNGEVKRTNELLTDECKRLTGEYNRFSNQLAAKKADYNELENEYAAQAKELTEVTELLEIKTGIADTLNSKCRELDSSLLAITNEKNELQTAFEGLKNAHKFAEDTIAAYEAAETPEPNLKRLSERHPLAFYPFLFCSLVEWGHYSYLYMKVAPEGYLFKGLGILMGLYVGIAVGVMVCYGKRWESILFAVSVFFSILFTMMVTLPKIAITIFLGLLAMTSVINFALLNEKLNKQMATLN